MRTVQMLRLGLAMCLAIVIVGCGRAAGPSASPSLGGGPVTTGEEAVARVVALEPRLGGITKRDPELIGQANWYEIAPASGVGAFLVTVRVGWGDCQAGCIGEHTWVYAVMPDGSVALQSEGGGTVPGDAWPSPGAGGGGDTGTGIRITATSGPTCPVETVPPDPACAARPVPGITVVIQSSTNDFGTKAELDATGSVFVETPPGIYLVTAADAAGFMSMPELQKVEVVAGQVASVTLSFDTGIR